jgi:hypothetical protein
VSFNLAVEAGQLAIVATFLPLAYLSRRSRFYPRLVLGAGSLSIVAVASVWLVERSLDISIFSCHNEPAGRLGGGSARCP